MTPEKLRESQAWADAHKLPRLEHVLTPRVKGFQSTMQAVRDRLVDVVYDVTIGYNGEIPSLWALAGAAANADVHVHVVRFPVASLPRDDAGLAAWAQARFLEKERLLAHLRAHGRFPAPQIDEPLIAEPAMLLAPRPRAKL